MPIGILFSALSLVGTAAGAPSHLVLTPCKFVEQYQFGTTECTVELKNTGERPIRIRSAEPAVAGDSLTPSSFEVPPHGTVYSNARIVLRNEIGRARRIFKLATDEPGQANRNIEVGGYVTSVLDDPLAKLDFGVVNLPGSPSTKSLAITSQDASGFRVTEIVSTPAYLDVKIDGGSMLQATVRPDAPWGLHESDFVKLKTNAVQQPELWIPVHVDVHGEVLPDSNPYALGLMRKGHANQFAIRITSREKKDFKIGKLSLSKIKGSVKVTECGKVEPGCKLLNFRIGDDQPAGSVGGAISVELPEFGQTLPIYVWGMLVGEKTVVRDFNEEMRRSEESMMKEGKPVESRTSQGVSSALLKDAINESIGQAVAEPPPSGTGPLLRWVVQNEELVHGYVVYRSDNEAGPFVRANKNTILVKSADNKGASYQWRDESAVAGKTYWYYVGVLNKDGAKSRLSSSQKIVAK